MARWPSEFEYCLSNQKALVRIPIQAKSYHSVNRYIDMKRIGEKK